MTKQNLVEIKKGQVGTGLLIENDGYVSIDMPQNRQLKESIGSKGTISPKDLPNPFIVSAVFQKYGVENANGRVYPEDILKREVEKYQQAIAERRAYGECNHPSESSIDLGRLALNIVELHWEGHTLVGQMEIPISEGFRNLGVISCFSDMIAHWIISGLKVGVSSRALGSVRQQYGQLIVGDDLELVCWDAVSQPSTPGAWISMEPSELKQYVESEKKDGELIKEDKFSKFDNWLND